MVDVRAAGAIDESAPPQVNLRVLLPGDAASIPIVRHPSEHAPRERGCRDGCADDIGLAITEACANVVQHPANGEVYAINVGIGADACEISIIESGTLLRMVKKLNSTRTPPPGGSYSSAAKRRGS